MPEPAPPHVGHLIRLAQQIHTRMWNATVSEEVTSPQFQLLSVLATAPNVDQRTATELARLDRSTRAEPSSRSDWRGYGLIERRRDVGDRRRYLLRLTPAGARHFVSESSDPRSEISTQRCWISCRASSASSFLDRLSQGFVEAAGVRGMSPTPSVTSSFRPPPERRKTAAPTRGSSAGS